MKVFLDTNIFLEYFECRRQYQYVSQLLSAVEQTMRLRQTLAIVLSLVTVAGISHKRMVSGNSDPAFDDIEDSFQYQCALHNKCDALVTINLKDFSRADTSALEILSPEEFAGKYL